MGQILSCGDPSADPLLEAKQLELDKTTTRAEKAKREAAIAYLQAQELKGKVLEHQKSAKKQSSQKEKESIPLSSSEKKETTPVGSEETKKVSASSPARRVTEETKKVTAPSPVRRTSTIPSSDKVPFSGISYNVKEYNYFDEVGFK